MSASPRWWPHPKRGRRPQFPSKVPFKDEWPLILKNEVSTRRSKESVVPCIKETLAFITCLKDHNNSHEMCAKEGEIVQKCYTNYLAEKNEYIHRKRTTGDFIPGKNVKDMEPEQLNKFLSHFPHKLKK